MLDFSIFSPNKEDVLDRSKYIHIHSTKKFEFEAFSLINPDNKLVKMHSGEKFAFDVIPGDHAFNQTHYEALGDV